jgi:hypothetical protein
MRKCVKCGITDLSRPFEIWWKCCPEHTPQYSVDIVCTVCAQTFHPNQTFDDPGENRKSDKGDGNFITASPSPDFVKHPPHYTAYKGLEIIDLTEQLNFNRGNAVKYICRAGLKSDSLDHEIEDLQKAAWYINREIERIQPKE